MEKLNYEKTIITDFNPAFRKMQSICPSTQATIQKQIDSSINANRDVTIFRVNQVSAIQVPGNLHQWNATIVGFDIMSSSSSTAIKASNDVVTLMTQINADKITIAALTVKIAALEAKIAAGLTVTGVAK